MYACCMNKLIVLIQLSRFTCLKPEKSYGIIVSIRFSLHVPSYIVVSRSPSCRVPGCRRHSEFPKATTELAIRHARRTS